MLAVQRVIPFSVAVAAIMASPARSPIFSLKGKNGIDLL
jgi:hypothetical protein